jgi:hypothetical protein
MGLFNKCGGKRGSIERKSENGTGASSSSSSSSASGRKNKDDEGGSSSSATAADGKVSSSADGASKQKQSELSFEYLKGAQPPFQKKSSERSSSGSNEDVSDEKLRGVEITSFEGSEVSFEARDVYEQFRDGQAKDYGNAISRMITRKLADEKERQRTKEWFTAADSERGSQQSLVHERDEDMRGVSVPKGIYEGGNWISEKTEDDRD